MRYVRNVRKAVQTVAKKPIQTVRNTHKRVCDIHTKVSCTVKKHQDHIKKRVNHQVDRTVQKYHKRVHQWVRAATQWIHAVEMVFLLCAMIVGVVFYQGSLANIQWTGIDLPDNILLDYPLKQVSTVECRTEHRTSLNADCKIDLPRIKNAQYHQYKQTELYTKIYTVLPWAPYSPDSRDTTRGDHPWVDIATAEGTPLYSLAYGQVTFAWYQNGYGNVVKVQFRYKGELLHATYAHMETMNVKAGDSIRRGQLIGTVGNSGNTFGWMWGYHLDFTISVDNQGRPMYAFLGCDQQAQWFTAIVNGWLCRTERLQNTYDPLALIEASSQWTPIVEEKVVVEIIDGSELNNLTNDLNMPDTIDLPIQPELPTQPTITAQPTPSYTVLTHQLQTDFMPYYIKEFLGQYSIDVQAVTATDKTSLVIQIKDKKTGESFSWILPAPFVFVSPQASVTLSAWSVQLVFDGIIDVTASTLWADQSIVIQFADQPITTISNL